MYPIYFLKAIANQSGYYLSGSPPRWHKWNKDRPAPADAHAVVSHASHVKAVQKLKAGHHAAPMDPQQMHSEVVALGTHLAAQSNALARLADVRKKILAGQKPQKNEISWAWKAPAEKRDAVIAEIKAKGNAESLKLLDEFLAAKPMDKDEALQAAIDHLSEDSKQPDIPADEHKEDAELVAKLKAAAGPEKVVPVGPVTIKPTPKDSLSVAPVVKDSLSTAPVAGDSLPVKTKIELNGEKFERQSDGSWTDEWGESLDNPAYSAALEIIAGGSVAPHKVYAWDWAYRKAAANYFASLGADSTLLLNGLFPVTDKIGSPSEGEVKVINGTTYAVQGGKWALPAQKPSVEDALNGLFPQNGPLGNEAYPTEGDTKEVKGVTYVLHNGRWHKQAGISVVVGAGTYVKDGDNWVGPNSEVITPDHDFMWLALETASGTKFPQKIIGSTSYYSKTKSAEWLAENGYDPATYLSKLFPPALVPDWVSHTLNGKAWVKIGDKWQEGGKKDSKSKQIGPFYPGGNTYTKKGMGWNDSDGFYYKPGDEVWLALEIADGADIYDKVLAQYSEASRQFVAEWIADKNLDVPSALQVLFPYSTDYPKAVDGSVKSVNGVHYQMTGGFWEKEDAKNASTNGGSEPPQEVVSADGLTFTLGADGKWLNEFGGTLIPSAEVALNLHAGLPHNMTTSQIKSGEFQKEVLEWMSDRGFNVPNGLEAFMPTWGHDNGDEWDVKGKSYIVKKGQWQLNGKTKPALEVTSNFGETFSFVNGSWVSANGKKIAPYAEVALNIHAGLPTGLGPAKEIHADLRDNVLFFMSLKGLDVSKGLDTFFPGSMFGDGMNWPVEGKNYVLKNGKWHEEGKAVKLDYKGNDYVLGADGQWVMNGGHKVSKATGVMLSLAAGQAVDLNVAANLKDDTKSLLLDSYVPDMVPAEQALDTLYPSHGPDGTWSHPTEGDTKTVNGVVYVLHNGRWHKQSTVAASPTPSASGKHPIYSVEAPSFEDLDKYFKPLAANKIDKYLALLRAQIKHGDVTSLKNSTKFMKATGKYIIHLPAGKVGGNNVYFKVQGGGPGAKMVYDYVNALKVVVAGKAPPKVAIPKAAPTPVQPPQPPVSPGQPFDIGAWKEKPGTQGGYNPGGEYTDPQGKKWYVKFPASEEAARTEVLANALYTLTGAYVPKVRLIQKNGKVGIASQWIDGAVVDKAALKAGTLTGAREFFAADAWLANYDVVGNNPAPGKGWDNIVNVGGKALRVEAGGALDHKGSGGKKPFGEKVTDLSTFRDPSINPNTAAVFGAMTTEEIADSVAVVAAIPDEVIQTVVEMFGAGDAAAKAKMAATLIKRRDDMKQQFPATPIDLKNLKFDKSVLPAKPDHINGGGHYNVNKSSNNKVNEVNQAAADEIETAANAGNYEAIKDLKIHVVDKATGTTTLQPVEHHPSQYVKKYYADVLEILQTVAYPTAKTLKQWIGKFVNGVADLAAQFPAHLYGVSIKHVPPNQRLGFWISLGDAVNFESALPDKEFNVTEDDKKKGSQSTKSMPSNLKTWMSSVKVSGSHNQPYRDGLDTDKNGLSTREVLKAAYKHAVEFKAGSRIRKGIDMGHDMIKALQAREPGHVFQNPGSMCTSLKPNWSWSGDAQLEIIYAEGAKGLYNIGVGGYDSEAEITTLPGQRFILLDKQPNNHFKLLMLPPDENYVNIIDDKQATQAEIAKLAAQFPGGTP